ncbi:hydroxymethylbilane synthase [Marinitenerispora sediminis]|uniref:Hydroxymethylbilane synthase n=1 Tax=Marinitenerispora sediminis TaxID=1931232 RepID=A0A368T4D0_9ACTN|nr:hydroxymethylbilane synthase [Marinitenerispora sediminis]RCV49681.1 hydroxymethylbilane synthase [Marinitenerispora sediminis]RCV52153.1 hydroxymethylbilane synthase [Marinitenerispora sediminis]RCV53150.1 hydroxymethylbilane synthase [Marinitenerispora sediminis]
MLSDRPPLRIGSRTSPMAMAQARLVQDLIAKVAGDIPTEIVGIETSGDQWMGDLAELGGKGAFLKEIDRHLMMGGIDVAMHAMKDVPGDVPLPEGTMFAAYLPREDVRDVLVVREGSPYTRLEEMPPGTRIGTSAVRRKAQLLKHRPDLHVDRIRGNVNTRIARLDAEKRFEAIILNLSGLHRVHMEHRASEVIAPDVMCPAVGSGVIGVQCRTADTGIAELLRLFDDAETRTHITAERTMLHGLRGHCNSPIAGHCHTTPDGQLSLIGMVFTREGGKFAYSHEWDSPERPAELGAYVAADLLRKGARGIIDGIPH